MIERPALAWWSYRPLGELMSRRVYVLRNPFEPLWHAPDIAHALDIDPAALDIAEVARYLPGWEDGDGWPVPFITTTDVRWIAADDPRFLEFIDGIVATFAASAVTAPSNHSTSTSRTVAPLVDVRADTFSVALAANILSRDPAIDLGRETLFAELRTLAWVTTDHSTWIPASNAEHGGWLVRNLIWDRRTKVSYNQIRITRAGLLELHHRLGGIADLDLDAAPTPALVDVT